MKIEAARSDGNLEAREGPNYWSLREVHLKGGGPRRKKKKSETAEAVQWEPSNLLEKKERAVREKKVKFKCRGGSSVGRCVA